MSGTALDVRLRMQFNTPNVPQVHSSTCLLSLQADSLGLNNNDPVSFWKDESGWGRNFSASGTSQPTYKVTGGFSYVNFDGIDDWMLGQNWRELDNLPSFTVFSVVSTPTTNAYGSIIYKLHSLTVPPTDGWGIGAWGTVIDVENISNGSAYTVCYLDPAPDLSMRHVFSSQIRDWNTDVSIFTDGVIVNNNISSGFPPPINSISTTEPVRLGITGDPINDGYSTMNLYSVMIYVPAPSDADRSIIEHWLANKYGITLP